MDDDAGTAKRDAGTEDAIAPAPTSISGPAPGPGAVTDPGVTDHQDSPDGAESRLGTYGGGDGLLLHTPRPQSRLQPGEPLHPIDRVLIEVICERAHCVIYEYAILTVKMIADEFRDRVKVKPVVRRGSKKNVDRYLELCRRNGRHLSVPTVLIDGDVAFTYVPEPKELRQAIAQAIERHTAGSEASPSG